MVRYFFFWISHNENFNATKCFFFSMEKVKYIRNKSKKNNNKKINLFVLSHLHLIKASLPLDLIFSEPVSYGIICSQWFSKMLLENKYDWDIYTHTPIWKKKLRRELYLLKSIKAIAAINKIKRYEVNQTKNSY